MVFYFGAKRDNSRNIPSEECSRTRLFREGEELQLSDSNSMNIPKAPVHALNFSLSF